MAKKDAETQLESPVEKASEWPKICYDRDVPNEYQPRHAFLERSILQQLTEANGTLRLRNLDPNEHDPARAAIILSKMWEKGHILTCRFLDGSTIQREKVEKKAKIWEQYANIKIQVTDQKNSDIRISFSADRGSWSAVGADALIEQYFPKYQPTMNFGWLKDDTDDKEYQRVVVHEFGHALGLIHEHQSPAEKLKWNKETVYTYFSGPPNFWSKDDIDHNILEKYSSEGLKFTTFDKASIMLYQFPAELFKNHVGTPLNFELSEKDKAFITALYPQ